MNKMTHDFDSSRTCNYCGIAAERVSGIAEHAKCSARILLAAEAIAPEELAAKVDLRSAMTPYEVGIDFDAAQREIVKAIRAAVAAEREACAQEAINHADRNRNSHAPMTCAGVEIAAIIRARGAQ